MKCYISAVLQLAGTLVFSTTKTDRHDIAEILLKVGLDTKNQNQSSFSA
jgi:hypothetical protein